MRRTLLAAALAAASLALYAQPYGPGSGPGPGARGRPAFGADATPGWAMMTPQERQAHQEKMRSMKDPGECQAYMTAHHAQMQERAKEKGRALPSPEPGPGCQWLKK